MTTPSNPADPFTPFLPSTYNIPEEEDRVEIFIQDTFCVMSDIINDKKIGMYVENAENLNGNKIFYDTTKKLRNGWQFLARIIEYPANGMVTVLPPPNINNQFVIFQVWGSASKPPTSVGAGDGDFFSFYSEGNSKITFTMTDLLITVTTVGLGTGYTGFIVIDYIRDGT